MTVAQSLKLLRAEAIITTAIISMPVMNSFFASIGLDQGQIGVSQAIFTLVLLLFNIPTGWLADRFSRKIANAFGDVTVASGFIFYALAGNFTEIIIAEVIIGIGIAFSHGADVGLLKAYCDHLQRSYRQESAWIAARRPIVEGAAAIAGGFIGAQNPRLALLLTAVPFLAGAVLSLGVKEVGVRRQRQTGTPVKGLKRQLRAAFSDMARITKYALHGHKDLAWSIVAAATAREITHAIIWVLTPLLLLAGVPAEVIGVAWAVNLAMVSIGAWLGGKVAERWSDARLFAVPAVASLLAMLTLAWQTNLWTIGLYAVFGLARGWYAAVMAPIVQRHTPDDMQSTVFSVSGSLGQLLYIVVVIAVNGAGNWGVQWAMLANALLFLPLVLLVVARLKRP
ncbi:MAG TPA: MFS transporter [Verrucomicrobiae bacterium]|nr:MFS transporter [Verrucomicrobiae bacterium]